MYAARQVKFMVMVGSSLLLSSVVVFSDFIFSLVSVGILGAPRT